MAKGTPPAHLCTVCQRMLPFEAFYPSARKHRRWTCRECARDRFLGVYARNKAFLDAYKLERGCTDCGYREVAVALEFDHLPGFKKLYQVSHMAASASLELLKAEIAKCEVVCANCHAIRTMKRNTVKEWYQALREGRPTPAQVANPQQSLDLDQ